MHIDIQPFAEYAVAPYVGAWIETYAEKRRAKLGKKSHPTWVRGLKHALLDGDNNFSESHPTWVRGLKHIANGSTNNLVSRTLRGCVD